MIPMRLKGWTCGPATCALLVVCCVAAAGAEGAADKVVITDIRGRSSSGILQKLSELKAVIGNGTVGAKEQQTFELADVLQIHWEDRKPRLLADEPLVLLGNGDRLVLDPVRIDEEFLTGSWVRSPAWPELRVPLETIRGLLLNPPRNRLERERLASRLIDQVETHDVLYLSNGDRATGQLLGLDQDILKLDSAGRELKLERAKVRALGMNPQLTSFPAVKGLRGIICLRDGSRLTVRTPELTADGKLSVQAAFGTPLEISTEEIVSWRTLGGNADYLSDLEPDEYEFTPYLSVRWPLRRDRSVVGGGLSLGNQEFAKGLGMHSQGLLTYKLGGKYKSFQAVVGIDDDVTKGGGSVVFRVLADGKQVYASPIVRGEHPPLAIPSIPLAGVQRLTLAVDFADFGDIQDHADWCDALLIR